MGSGGFIPGFEDQLIGASAGEQRSFEITFPADYGSADLAGKAANFAVKVKEVRGLAEQAIDETLATALGLENLDELRKTVREQIERDYGRLARQKLKRDLLDRLAERHHFPVPDGMVQIEFDTIWKQVEDERKRQQEAGPAAAAASEPEKAAEPEPEKAAASEPETAAEPATAGEAAAPAPAPAETAGAEDDEKLKAEYRAIAERRVRLGLLLAEVGRGNNISVTQDELNRALLETARRFPGQERNVVEYYRNNPQLLDGLRAPIYEDKVVDFILELAQVSERAVAPKELVAITEALDEDEATPKSEESPAS